MAKEIFISYSRRDFDKVKSIKDEIDQKLGIDCWMDIDGIESGEQFEDVIISAINSHDTMLFMLSSNSMHSEWALDELDFARRKNKRIVLLYVEPCEMTDKFYFRYHKYDTIEWNNPLQHDKLISNLQSWFPDAPQHISQNMPEKSESHLSKYIKAAEQGDAQAQYFLGISNINGNANNGQRNYPEAVKWLKKASEQGYADAQYELGVCFYNGYGVPKDYFEAVKWYKHAAEQGHAHALSNLGGCYYYGIGINEDKAKAVKCYKQAAIKGEAYAIKWIKQHNID